MVLSKQTGSKGIGMLMKEYTSAELASQPIGYWTGEAHRRVVGRIRSDLALEGLTQPHWWTLNHVAGAPGTLTRAALAERLQPFDDQGTDFEAVFDDLITRGWLAATAGTLTTTEAGEAGRLRAATRGQRANELMHDGVDPADYAVAVNVLRRVIGNLGGSSDLP